MSIHGHGHMPARRDVVGRCIRVKILQKPETLLRKGQRKIGASDGAPRYGERLRVCSTEGPDQFRLMGRNALAQFLRELSFRSIATQLIAFDRKSNIEYSQL